jgi:hypothetical protein
MKNIYQYSIALIVLVFLFQSCAKKESIDLENEIASPASDNSAEPNLISGADGNLYISWIEKKDDLAILKFSKWEQIKWSESEVIAEGNDWFVNWADYPALAVNENGDMVAHYLQMSDTGSYTYDIKVVSKKSGANNWSAPIKLHRDSVNAEHGFVSIMPMSDGQFFFAWLDGRNTVSSDPAHAGHHGHGGGGPMTVRTAVLSSELEISEEAELDNRVCDCCQTGAAITSNGPLVIYRDRSEAEIRDMSIVRLVDGVWTDPKTIYDDNWNIAGCPVNGPKVAVIGNSVAIAWFTAAEGVPKVNLVYSNNGGESFANPIQLDQGKSIGRIDVDMIDSETAFVSWMEGSDIVAAKISFDGSIVKRYDLAISNEARNSGFPQIALIGNKVMLAWTDSAIKKIKTKLISL